MNNNQIQNAESYSAIFDASNMTQTEAVLDYMQRYGSITPLEALHAIGCFRLSARIADLKAQGYAIATRISTGRKKYAIYSLITTGEDA